MTMHSKKYFHNSVKNETGKIAILVFFIITAEILNVCFPLIGRYLIDTVIPCRLTGLLLKVALLYLCMYLVFIILKYINLLLGVKIQVNIESNMRINIINQAFRGIFSNITTGDAVFTFYNDIQDVASMFTNVYISIFQSVLSIIISTVLLSFIDLRLIAIAIIPCPIIYAINKISLTKIFKLNYEFKNSNSKLIDEIKTFWNFKKNVFIFNAFRYLKNKISTLQKKRNVDFFLAFNYTQLVTVVQMMISYIPNIIVFLLGAYWVINGTMTIGTFIASRALFGNIYQPFKYIITIGPKLQSYNASLKRIDDCAFGFSRTIMSSDEYAFTKCESGIKFSDVCFAYDASKPFIINNFNFGCQKKSIIKIEADNGMGKSTLFDILSGYIIQDSGTVKLDEFISTNDNYCNFSSCLSYSTQEDAIFNDSVFRNCILDNHFSQSDVIEMWKMLGFYDSINMTFNLNSIVSSSSLSGGQKKKIALVRTFLINKNIILLDEPFAPLDKKSQQSLINWLDKLHDKKIILISDHTGTVDKICTSIIKL